MSDPKLLVLTGGHRVDLPAFLAMVEAICAERGWDWEHHEQPGAQRLLRPDHAGRWVAVLAHDLPGLHLKRGEPPCPVGPDGDTAQALVDLLAAGQPMVHVHHALAGWPAWHGWGDALGGRFRYAPLDDEPCSGTRVTTYTASVVSPDHPVCQGMSSFTLTDELYTCPVLDDEVVPLMAHDSEVDGRFYTSTYEHVLVGQDRAPDCRDLPPANRLVAWARAAGRSPLVYVQPGDSAATFARRPYRRLVGNALGWVASEEGRAWAAEHGVPISVP